MFTSGCFVPACSFFLFVSFIHEMEGLNGTDLFKALVFISEMFVVLKVLLFQSCQRLHSPRDWQYVLLK